MILRMVEKARIYTFSHGAEISLLSASFVRLLQQHIKICEEMEKGVCDAGILQFAEVEPGHLVRCFHCGKGAA